MNVKKHFLSTIRLILSFTLRVLSHMCSYLHPSVYYMWIRSSVNLSFCTIICNITTPIVIEGERDSEYNAHLHTLHTLASKLSRDKGKHGRYLSFLYPGHAHVFNFNKMSNRGGRNYSGSQLGSLIRSTVLVVALLIHGVCYARWVDLQLSISDTLTAHWPLT